METRAHYVAVGAFVLAIILLAFVAVLWFGRVEFSKEVAPYYVFFKGSVEGLSKGSAVQYNGIPVGRVTDIRVDPDNVEQIQATIEIDPNLVSIKSNARAYLDTNILSGVSTVQIRGGTREASDLLPEPGHRYPIIKTGQSALEEVKSSLPELLAQLKTAAGSLNALLSAQNRQAVSESLQNIRTITAAIAANSKEFGATVANADATIIALKSLLQHVDHSYADRGGLKDEAARALDDYDRLAKNLIGSSRQVQAMIQENRPGIRDFSQQTLVGVDNLVGEMRQLVASLTRFADEIEHDPTRLLFGDRREGYRPR